MAQSDHRYSYVSINNAALSSSVVSCKPRLLSLAEVDRCEKPIARGFVQCHAVHVLLSGRNSIKTHTDYTGTKTNYNMSSGVRTDEDAGTWSVSR